MSTVLGADVMSRMEQEMLPLGYYWGITDRHTVETYLKKDGDFAVRRALTPQRTACTVISVRSSGIVLHVMLGYKSGEWNLRRVLHNGPTLVQPVSRPSGDLLHEQILFNVKARLGGGAYGDVFVGLLKDGNSFVEVAVKRAKKGTPADGLHKEANVMMLLNHPNVLRSYGYTGLRKPHMLVLELAAGALEKMLQEHPNIQLKKLLEYATNAARGLLYLAGQKIIHRDIAARNCLIGYNGEVKIADFGLAVIGLDKLSERKLVNVPIRWLAPETLRKGRYSPKTDVWSFGVMLWEVFTRCAAQPYAHVADNKDVKQLVCSGVQPLFVPDESPDCVKRTVRNCLLVNAELRPDFGEIYRALTSS